MAEGILRISYYNHNKMKRLLIFLFFFCTIDAFGQTFCYKSLYRVDIDTEVKEKMTEEIRYITFTSKRAKCYFSDAEGNTVEKSEGVQSFFGMAMPNPRRYSGRNTYEYIGTENEMYIYRSTTTEYMYVVPNYYMGEPGGYYPFSQSITYLYFSKDFLRMNQWSDPETHYIKSTNQSVLVAQSGYSMGKSMASTTGNSSYIYVYEQIAAPNKDKAPSRMY